MDKEYIEIRSNIVDGFNAHVAREIEKEELEKQERARRLEIEKAKRMEKYEEWKKTHPNCAAYAYTNEYSFETISDYSGGYCKINFYEWGDINSIPRKFDYYYPLYKFLDSCGLFLTSEQNAKIKPLSTCYITCKPNSRDMVVAATYEGLKMELELAQSIDAAMGLQNEVKQTLPAVVNAPTRSYNDYDEDDCYYCDI